MTELITLLATAFFISLLVYCLRMGVVGGGWAAWQADAHRNKQPIRYWTGIAVLAFGSAFSMFALVYIVLVDLR